MTDSVRPFNFIKGHSSVAELPGVTHAQKKCATHLQSLLNRQLRFAASVAWQGSHFGPLSPDTSSDAVSPLQLVSRNKQFSLVATLDQALAHSYINLRQGGLPQQLEPSAPLGQMGTALLQQMGHLLADAMNQSWQQYRPLGLEVGKAADLTTTLIDNAEQQWLHCVYTVTLADKEGRLTVSFPPPVLARLKRTKGGQSTPKDPVFQRHISQHIFNVPVEIVALVGEAELTIDDLQKMQPGDVIQLDRFASDPIDIKVEGRPLFKGEPGLSRGKHSIKIVS